MTSGTQASVPVVAFRGVTKRFGSLVAARELELDVGAGEFLSFLGPSGCGKTTSLRMIAGFEQPSEGEVMIDGERVNGIPAYRRPVNMVFQHYALFPHLNVADNVAYGLKQRSPRPPRAEIERRVGAILDLVRLGGYERRRSWEMSGGQQQRVALARALINEPKVLLLDEPTAGINPTLINGLIDRLKRANEEFGITLLVIEHNMRVIMNLAEHIYCLAHGEMLAEGNPDEIQNDQRVIDAYLGAH